MVTCHSTWVSVIVHEWSGVGSRRTVSVNVRQGVKKTFAFHIVGEGGGCPCVKCTHLLAP